MSLSTVCLSVYHLSSILRTKNNNILKFNEKDYIKEESFKLGALSFLNYYIFHCF